MDYKDYFLHMEFNIRLHVLPVTNLIRLMTNYGNKFYFLQLQRGSKIEKKLVLVFSFIAIWNAYVI